MFQRLQRQMEKKKKEAREKEAKMAEKVNKSSFGLKKGFLGGDENNNNKNAASASVKKEERKSKVVELVPKKQAENPLRLKEVQQALDATKEKGLPSFGNDKLMKDMMMNPNLMKKIQNPRIMAAMDLMKSDPEAAKLKYKDDKEVMDFIREFSSLMSTHYNYLAEEMGTESNNVHMPGPPTKHSKKVDIIPVKKKEAQKETPMVEYGEPAMHVSDEIKALLSDPEVQELLDILRNSRMDVRQYLQLKPHMMPKIQELLKHKLLDVQS